MIRILTRQDLEEEGTMAYQSVNPYDGKILKTFEELAQRRHH
jgi:hypothetical protein